MKPKYHVASFSGGKDSTAMVLHMIERGDHLDEVVFCDTTMEFPAMIRHVEKVKQVIEAAGIKFTTLRAEHDFEYYLLEHQPEREPSSRYFGKQGYGWPGVFSRWCTRALKKKLINDHLRALRSKYEVIQYIGLAADEDYRLERATNQDKSHRHPLRDWDWTEADAMAYCRAKGYDWEGLYDIFNRVSCWCCPLQPHEELRKLRKHFPDLWTRLLDLDSRQCKPFNKSTVANFDLRFALEDALTEAGQSIKNRAFFADLKRLLEGEASIEDILKERTD
jgi:3'-phosphoadenosine 5'-phosphosulfate sulfotransferase (PAPS reductase)/FAD synthetase